MPGVLPGRRVLRPHNKSERILNMRMKRSVLLAVLVLAVAALAAPMVGLRVGAAGRPAGVRPTASSPPAVSGVSAATSMTPPAPPQPEPANSQAAGTNAAPNAPLGSPQPAHL